jgi:hypothetical protein
LAVGYKELSILPVAGLPQVPAKEALAAAIRLDAVQEIVTGARFDDGKGDAPGEGFFLRGRVRRWR